MLIVEDLGHLPRPLEHPILAIGVFDGVHVGHQAILRRLRERASERRGTAVVMTFSPHPQKVIRPDHAPLLIQTEAQKEEMLRAMGLEVAVRLPFTRRLSLFSPLEFVREILARHGVREIHVGSNFRFGHRRSGDFDTLRELGGEYGFEVYKTEPVCFRGSRVSSTRVRSALAEGQVGQARRLLGRPYEMRGTVVRGAGRGAGLGFATANLQAENELIPAVGVYTTRTRVNGDQHPSVTNIGYRPTVAGERPASPVVETHILDYHGDLYGKGMSLEFYRRIRPEMKFAGLPELVERIAVDTRRTRIFWRRVQGKENPR